MLAQIGDLDAALAEAREAVRLKPENAAGQNNLACVLRDKGDLDSAIVVFREAIHLKPDFVESHNNLGFVLRSRKEISTARQRSIAKRRD